MFFVLTKFSKPNSSHKHAHRIYRLTVVHLFKCIFNLDPALLICCSSRATIIRHLIIRCGRMNVMCVLSDVMTAVFMAFYVSPPACKQHIVLSLNLLVQEWAISGPWATCGPPQRFQWRAEAFRKDHQVWNFLQLITANVSVQASLNRDTLLFLLEQRFSIWDREFFLNAKISM